MPAAKKAKKSLVDLVNVEWTTERVADSGKTAYICYGKFSENALRKEVIKEINSAPVDVESLESRSSKNVLLRPADKGFYETAIKVDTYVDIDEASAAKLAYKLLKKSHRGKVFSYIFDVPHNTGM